jgi:hypothetical protein
LIPKGSKGIKARNQCNRSNSSKNMNKKMKKNWNKFRIIEEFRKYHKKVLEVIRKSHRHAVFAIDMIHHSMMSP